MPGDIRRMVQSVCMADTQSLRKKPIFVERKIGKSMSVNAQLGFPLKVLEELNESIEKDSPTPSSKSSSGSVTPTGTSTAATKAPFFEHTYQQIRQQNRLRPNRLDAAIDSPSAIDIKLPDHVERVLENLTVSPKELDSGISTPVSPRTCGIAHEIIEPTSPSILYSADMHPLSSCEDVNFKFNGTTQLKSFRPQHYHSGGGGGGAGGRSMSGIGISNTMTTTEATTADHASNSVTKMGRS